MDDSRIDYWDIATNSATEGLASEKQTNWLSSQSILTFSPFAYYYTISSPNENSITKKARSRDEDSIWHLKLKLRVAKVAWVKHPSGEFIHCSCLEWKFVEVVGKKIHVYLLTSLACYCWPSLIIMIIIIRVKVERQNWEICNRRAYMSIKSIESGYADRNWLHLGLFLL